MEHSMKLFKEPFDMIKNGQKTIELRLFDEKRRLVKPHDIITFSCTENKSDIIRAEVIDIHVFGSFKELYENLPLEKCGYHKGEKADPDDMLKYYTREKESEYGVVGIEVKVIG